MAACDRQASVDRYEATKPIGLDPTHIIAWPLLFNDIARQKQREANQPRRLQEIEQQRQQCYQMAQAAARSREEVAQANRNYRRLGYDPSTVIDFVIDGNRLAARQAKIMLRGNYYRTQNSEWMFTDYTAVIKATRYPSIGRNEPKVPLLTNNASRAIRRRMLFCATDPSGSQLGCPITIIGHAEMCDMTSPFGQHSVVACLNVEDGR